MTRDEKLARKVPTDTLTKALALWDAMLEAERMEFLRRNPGASEAKFELLRAELVRRAA